MVLRTKKTVAIPFHFIILKKLIATKFEIWLSTNNAGRSCLLIFHEINISGAFCYEKAKMLRNDNVFVINALQSVLRIRDIKFFASY
jgi:hypothetical protein